MRVLGGTMGELWQCRKAKRTRKKTPGERAGGAGDRNEDEGSLKG